MFVPVNYTNQDNDIKNQSRPIQFKALSFNSSTTTPSINSNLIPLDKDTVSLKVQERDIQTKKEGLSTGVKWFTGLSLTALTATVIYFTTRGRVKSATTTSSNLDTQKQLQEQIKNLKNTIKNNYLQKKDAEMKKIKLDLSLRSVSGIHKKKNYFLSLDIMQNEIVAAQKVLDDYSQNVKNKLRALSQDLDWIECRKLRKQYIKISKSVVKGQMKKPDGFDAINEKMSLINAVIEAKIKGESPYLNILGYNIEDAMEIIRNKNLLSYEEVFHTIRKNLPKEMKYKDIYGEDHSKYPLKIKNLFDGYYKVEKAKEVLKMNPVGIVELKDAYLKKTKILEELAKETRESSDVKKLKELIAQLKSN